ncbi:hypothetical protein BCR44DRAFT_1175709 [Catenaria anguillulae PL171]|uniref:Uncharacterized protein n=1 Tax=Catenaria anguillulae PL171 TaxID=765915 RepID=A0A1Y2I0W7_9FUNG|nr:hypothetical protein BCR44DRAFT_1175709 [Catenaria anguillulae PL171]
MESSQESLFYIDPFEIEFEDWPQLGVATTPVTPSGRHLQNHYDSNHDPQLFNRPDSPQPDHIFATSSSSPQRSSTSGSAKSTYSLRFAANKEQTGGIVCLPPILHVPFSDVSKPAHLTFRIANHGTQPCRFRVFLASGAPTFTLELDKLAVLYPGKEQAVHLYARPTSGWVDHVDELCIQTNIGKEIRVPVVLSPAPCPPDAPVPLRVVQGDDVQVAQVITITNPTPRTFHLSAHLAAGIKSLFSLDRDNVKVEGNDSAFLTVTCNVTSVKSSDFPPPKSNKPNVFTDTLTLTLYAAGPTFHVPLILHLLPRTGPVKPSRLPTKQHKSRQHAVDPTGSQPSTSAAPSPSIPFSQLWRQHDAAFRAHCRHFTPWTTYTGIPPMTTLALAHVPAPPPSSSPTEFPLPPPPAAALSPSVVDRMDALMKSLSTTTHPTPTAQSATTAHVFRMHCRTRLSRAIHLVVLRCRMNKRLAAIRDWAAAGHVGATARIGGGSVLGLAHGSRDMLHVPPALGFRDADESAVPQPLRPKSGTGAASGAMAGAQDGNGFNESLLVLLSEMDLAPEKTRLIDPLPVVPEASALDEHGDGLGAVAGDAGGADRPGTGGGDDGAKNRRTSVASAGSKRGSAGGARPGTATGKGADKAGGAAAAGSSKPGSSKVRGTDGSGGGSRPNSRQGAGGQKQAGSAKGAGQKGGV